MKHVRILITLSIFICLLLGCGEENNPVNNPDPFYNIAMTREQVASFFGVNVSELKGKLVYVKSTAKDNYTYFIDFSNDPLQEKQLCTISKINSPLISPDGNLVTFFTGNLVTGKVYVCKAAANTTLVELAQGFSPHWWQDSQGNLFVVYCTKTGSMEWPNPGHTIRQQINPTSLEAQGSPDTLVPFSLNGGLSNNGRYLSTAYKSTGIYDITTQQWKPLISSTQACNASISPASDESLQPQMMHLTLGGLIQGKQYKQHEAIIIRDTTTADPDNNVKKIVSLIPSVTEWQRPEWSTNYNFGVTLGKVDDLWYIYMMDLVNESIQKVVIDSNLSFDVYPHLWVPASY